MKKVILSLVAVAALVACTPETKQEETAATDTTAPAAVAPAATTEATVVAVDSTAKAVETPAK